MANSTELTNELRQAIAVQDTVFVLFCGFFVFGMQCGFSMLEAGSIRKKNVISVLMKNILDACLSAFGYYFFGYSLAFSNQGSWGVFIGGSQLFALANASSTEYVNWFFQWGFTATAATIVSGCLLERTSIYAYLANAFIMSSVVQPAVVHWVWGGGWLGNGGLLGGMVDFAGCSVVHIVGGVAGLVGAYFVGPRQGRFNGMLMKEQSTPLVALGALFLWISFYGFGPGSTGGVSGGKVDIVVRSVVNTTFGAASGGFFSTVFVWIQTERYGEFCLKAACNGVLAGLVAITACSGIVEPHFAIVIGIVGAVVYHLAVRLLEIGKIDDPVEAFPVHGAVGFWGLVAAGLFNHPELQKVAGYPTQGAGLFYGGEGAGKLLGANIIGSGVIALWSAIFAFIYFGVMKSIGLLRVKEDIEQDGLDNSYHGAKAYPSLNEDAPNLANGHGQDEVPVETNVPIQVGSLVQVNLPDQAIEAIGLDQGNV